MTFPIYLYIAVLFLAALLSSRLMKLLKLPNVTGYIVTGIIMGPFVFGLFFNDFSYSNIETSVIAEHINSLNWVSTAALGFIAFSIGTSFKTSVIKKVGRSVLIITVFESLMASLLVILALLVAYFVDSNHIKIELVLTLGAIASATAPAATLMIIKQYRARGKMVDTLLPVVALDDASALILFAILFQISNTIALGGDFDFYKMLIKPFLEIIISLGIGAVLGFFISWLNRYFKSRNNKMMLCIVAIFASLGLYILFQNKELGGFELSSLLMCMMAGAIYTNLSKDSNRTLDIMDRFTSPLYLMFFVISGASLNLKIFANDSGLLVLIVASIYIVFRVVGKYLGAFTGASISHCSKEVRNYLGLTLVPQAGVAIGLATQARNTFYANGLEESSALIMAIVLTSTLIYELIGPLVSKYALDKAGQIPKEEITIEKNT